MTVDEAIKTAIEFETRVRDAYAAAAARVADPAAKKVLGVLAGEEQGHLNYLHSRLEEWRRDGRLTVEQLGTAVPSRAAIAEGVRTLKAGLRLADAAKADAEAVLRRALGVEAEVGAFYRRMVAELPGDTRAMFARFVEIEGGHLAIVQAELDAVTGQGFWFDFQEWRFDGG
jgi:rubrerythrin